MANIKVIGHEFTREIEYGFIEGTYTIKEWRYIIVDAETGEILDDAQGYGYKTKQNAYKCWGYKHSDKHKSKHEYTDEEIDNELFRMKVLSQGGI